MPCARSGCRRPQLIASTSCVAPCCGKAPPSAPAGIARPLGPRPAGSKRRMDWASLTWKLRTRAFFSRPPTSSTPATATRGRIGSGTGMFRVVTLSPLLPGPCSRGSSSPTAGSPSSMSARGSPTRSGSTVGAPPGPSPQFPTLFSHCVDPAVFVAAVLHTGELVLPLRGRLSSVAAADLAALRTKLAGLRLGHAPDTHQLR